MTQRTPNPTLKTSAALDAAAVPPTHVAATEDTLAANLAAANRRCTLTPPRVRSLRGFCNLLLFKMLNDTIDRINAYHASVVRVLNRIVQMLEGQDPVAPEWLQHFKRNVTLTELLAERLAEYDAMRIEERLRALETATADRNKTPR